jgi:hypothetical protein
MIKPAVLKKALSLRKSGISNEMCIAVIYDLCKDVRDPHNAAGFATIAAFYEEQEKLLRMSIDHLEAENKRLAQYRDAQYLLMERSAKERKEP